MKAAVSERVYLGKQRHRIINEDRDWLVSGSIKVRCSMGCVGVSAKNKLLTGLKQSKWQNRNKYTWFKYRKNREVHAVIRITNSRIQGSRRNAAGSLQTSARCWSHVTMQVSWSWAGTNHPGMSAWRQKGLRDGANQRPLPWLPPDTRSGQMVRYRWPPEGPAIEVGRRLVVRLHEGQLGSLVHLEGWEQDHNNQWSLY